MRESDTTLVAMRDVYFSHPAAPTVKTVPIDVSAIKSFIESRNDTVTIGVSPASVHDRVCFQNL